MNEVKTNKAEERDEVEYRLFEAMRARSICSTTTNSDASDTIVIPILMSMRTSGPDPKKHAILELSWMMIGPTKGLRDQPCKSIKFEFDPTENEHDNEYMTKFRLKIDDYIKSKHQSTKKKELYSKADGIGLLWNASIVESQKQIQAMRKLNQTGNLRRGRPLYLFYNDDNAIRFFYNYMLRYRKGTDHEFAWCGNLYVMAEQRQLDLDRFGMYTACPAKYKSGNSFNRLPIEAKIRLIYGFDCDLEFPDPIGKITENFETDSTPAQYKIKAREKIDKRMWRERSPDRPIYLPEDEIHILLVIYCTLTIRGPWWKEMCKTAFSGDLATRRIIDILASTTQSRDAAYWTDEDPDVKPYSTDIEALKGEWELKDDPHPDYKHWYRVREVHEERNEAIVQRFLKFAAKLELDPASRRYTLLFDKFNELGQINCYSMDQNPVDELWMGPVRPHDDWIKMFQDAVEQTGLTKDIDTKPIEDMKEMKPTGRRPLTERQVLMMGVAYSDGYQGIEYDKFYQGLDPALIKEARENGKRQRERELLEREEQTARYKREAEEATLQREKKKEYDRKIAEFDRKSEEYRAKQKEFDRQREEEAQKKKEEEESRKTKP